MKHYQDTETGQIHAFDDGVNPFELGYRSIPKTLSETIIPKPNDEHVWLNGDWIHQSGVPLDYKTPVSSVPADDPAWVAFLQPYTWILSEGEVFSVSLEQINANGYPGGRLAEVVATLPTGGPLKILVTRDGALCVPMVGDTQLPHKAAAVLNQTLCALLLGGIFVEVADHNEVVAGGLQEDNSLAVYQDLLHSRLRNMWSGMAERVALLHPRLIRVPELQEAYAYGMTAIRGVASFSPYFLLHGYTALQYLNLSDALGSLWISVEQLTSFLWREKFLCDESLHPKGMKGRFNSLKEDNRTWPTSVKLELLWQAKLVTETSYASLDTARRARNKLVHEGVVPERATVAALWPGIAELLQSASGVSMDKLTKMISVERPAWKPPANINTDGWRALEKNLGEGKP